MVAVPPSGTQGVVVVAVPPPGIQGFVVLAVVKPAEPADFWSPFCLATWSCQLIFGKARGKHP